MRPYKSLSHLLIAGLIWSHHSFCNPDTATNFANLLRDIDVNSVQFATSFSPACSFALPNQPEAGMATTVFYRIHNSRDAVQASESVYKTAIIQDDGGTCWEDGSCRESWGVQQ